MIRTIFITGATDGIGFETAKLLATGGHTLLLHGRSDAKLATAKLKLSEANPNATIETFRADLSNLPEVADLAAAVKEKHTKLDVLINNAGVFKTAEPLTDHGYDVRFIVNTVAPYLLTRLLMEVIPASGRIVNLSSAAQAPVDLDALNGRKTLSDNEAYAQSKLGITMWSFAMANSLSANGPLIISVNPGSLLASKMVKEAYGIPGHDISVGAEILIRASLDEEFSMASGRYFDNDSKKFAAPHSDALDVDKNLALTAAMDKLIAGIH